MILLTHDRGVLNWVREAHVLALGGSVEATSGKRKIQVR